MRPPPPDPAWVVPEWEAAYLALARGAITDRARGGLPLLGLDRRHFTVLRAEAGRALALLPAR